MGRAMLFSVSRGGEAGLALLLLLPLLQDGVTAMDCSRFPMWNACRGAVSYHGTEQSLLPETPKRSQIIQQSPFYLASSGWQTAIKETHSWSIRASTREACP